MTWHAACNLQLETETETERKLKRVDEERKMKPAAALIIAAIVLPISSLAQAEPSAKQLLSHFGRIYRSFDKLPHGLTAKQARVTKGIYKQIYQKIKYLYYERKINQNDAPNDSAYIDRSFRELGLIGDHLTSWLALKTSGGLKIHSATESKKGFELVFKAPKASKEEKSRIVVRVGRGFAELSSFDSDGKLMDGKRPDGMPISTSWVSKPSSSVDKPIEAE